MLKPMKTGKHKAYKHSHISERKFRELLRAFSIDLNAYEASQLTAIARKSCRRIYSKLRLRIAKLAVDAASQTLGEFECDES